MYVSIVVHRLDMVLSVITGYEIRNNSSSSQFWHATCQNQIRAAAVSIIMEICLTFFELRRAYLIKISSELLEALPSSNMHHFANWTPFCVTNRSFEKNQSRRAESLVFIRQSQKKVLSDWPKSASWTRRRWWTDDWHRASWELISIIWTITALSAFEYCLS